MNTPPSIKDIVQRKVSGIISQLPIVVGNEAVKWSQERFLEQNWLSDGAQPWQQRKAENKKTAGRKILIQSGRLFRSIRIIDANANTVTIGVTDVPYAAIHNYGGEIHQAARSETFVRGRKVRGINKGQFKKGVTAGRGFTFKERRIVIPQRQFIGYSPDLVKRLITKSQSFISSRLK